MKRAPTFAWKGVFGVVIGLAACGREQGPYEAPAAAQAPVVYGEDDRIQWYAVTDDATRELMRSSIAAMIDEGSVLPNDDGSFDLLSFETLGESNQMCADQRFYDEPTASICSGTLIDEQLLLTAGHCVQSLADCAGYAWVFDYRYEADGVLATIGPDSVYHCVDLVTNGFNDIGDGYDFAIVQLDRPVVDRTPAKVRRPGPVGRSETLSIMGFPNGIPMKLAANGSVIDPRAGDDTWFVGAVDAFYGNSGSGVFGDGMEVVGILVTGADDYVDAGSCTVVQVLDPADGEEDMTYASRAVTELCTKGYPSVALCGEGVVATCGDGWCTGAETVADCPGDCDGLFAVPAAWTCNAGFYAAQDGCDCACGAYDPDCDSPQQDVYNCYPGSGCLADGACETPIPAAWTCSTDYFGIGDDCDCGCGAYDPDCDTDARVVGCARGSACNPDGTCEVPIPETWSCSRRWYGARDGCDCDCGAVDPDCAVAGQVVSGCSPGSACNADGTCVEPIPAGWLCLQQYYGSGDDCDCNCGAYDPDCNDPSARVLNCGTGEGCSATGHCRAGGSDPEPQPEPSPEVAPEASPEVAPEAGPEPTPEPTPEVDDASGPDTAAEAGKVGGRAADDGCAGGGEGAGAGLAFAVFAQLLLWPRRAALRSRL